MTGIATLDLAQFRIDEESFLGQAVSLGIRFRKLPDHTAEGLLNYLRVRSMTHAGRTRHGIALSKDDLARSVRQAMVCVELGLLEAAEGDLNQAVDCLAEGDFESLRKRGYETAYDMLDEMRGTSERLAEAIPGGLLKAERVDLERWGKLVPETWTTPAEEGEEGDTVVDPMRDIGSFGHASARAELLLSLPPHVLSELDEVVGDEGTWDAVVRNMILAVGLDRETLLPEPEDVLLFESTCFDEGGLRPAIGDKVRGQFTTRLESLDVSAEAADAILGAVENEIQLMELSVPDGLAAFFLSASDTD